MIFITEFNNLIKDTRLTMISSDGEVLYDNFDDSINENHLQREEIAALKDENLKLKRKMLQLLELVKRNGQQ